MGRLKSDWLLVSSIKNLLAKSWTLPARDFKHTSLSSRPTLFVIQHYCICDCSCLYQKVLMSDVSYFSGNWANIRTRKTISAGIKWDIMGYKCLLSTWDESFPVGKQSYPLTPWVRQAPSTSDGIVMGRVAGISWSTRWKSHGYILTLSLTSGLDLTDCIHPPTAKH